MTISMISSLLPNGQRWQSWKERSVSPILLAQTEKLADYERALNQHSASVPAFSRVIAPRGLLPHRNGPTQGPDLRRTSYDSESGSAWPTDYSKIPHEHHDEAQTMPLVWPK
jgi:hypothetical protein